MKLLKIIMKKLASVVEEEEEEQEEEEEDKEEKDNTRTVEEEEEEDKEDEEEEEEDEDEDGEGFQNAGTDPVLDGSGEILNDLELLTFTMEGDLIVKLLNSDETEQKILKADDEASKVDEY